MKNITIAVFGGGAMLSALAAGYCFSQGIQNFGWLFVVISLILLLLLRSRLRALKTPAEKAEKALQRPAINLAFCGELSRLIDEGKDINGYLRECGAPENVVKSINIGGSTVWYYHRDDCASFDEFRADYPLGETPFISHPYIKSQHVTDQSDHALHTITVDLYRALWDWGEQHPEKRCYANSIRIAFHGAYKPGENGGNSYLDKSIDDIRSARRANKKKPKKQKKSDSQESV